MTAAQAAQGWAVIAVLAAAAAVVALALTACWAARIRRRSVVTARLAREILALFAALGIPAAATAPMPWQAGLPLDGRPPAAAARPYVDGQRRTARHAQ